MKQVQAKDGTLHAFPENFAPKAVRLAMLAYENAKDWGGVAKQVGNVVREEALKAYVRAQRPYDRPSDADRDIVGKVKAGLLTAVGVDAAAGSYAAGLLKGTHPHFQLGDNALQLLNSPFGDRPYTLGNVQIYPEGQGPDVVHRSYTGAQMRRGDHEAAHSAQAQRMWAIPMGLAWLAGGGGVGSNPLEIDADEFAVRRRQERGR